MVASESVHAHFLDPVLHALDHLGAHLIVIVIELSGIRPIVGRYDIAVFIGFVPVLVLGDPRVIPAGMIGYPVQNDLEALFVSGGHQVLEIVQCAEFGVHVLIIGDRVVGAQRTLAFCLADRMDRHEPQGVDARLLESVEVLLKSRKGTFLSILSDIDLIQYTGLDPRGRGALENGIFIQNVRHHSVDDRLFLDVIGHDVFICLWLFLFLFLVGRTGDQCADHTNGE